MSKKIVIDKEDWEKIAQEFNSNDLPKVTEIDTDQSIVDRAERYSHLINKNDEMREFFAYKAGATEQDLISKARENKNNKIKLIKASLQGSLDGLELDNTDEVIEKSTVIEMINDLIKLTI